MPSRVVPVTYEMSHDFWLLFHLTDFVQPSNACSSYEAHIYFYMACYYKITAMRGRIARSGSSRKDSIFRPICVHTLNRMYDVWMKWISNGVDFIHRRHLFWRFSGFGIVSPRHRSLFVRSCSPLSCAEPLISSTLAFAAFSVRLMQHFVRRVAIRDRDTLPSWH